MCAPGYRYPPWQTGPFQGIELESATQDEYDKGFDCIPVECKYTFYFMPLNEEKKRHCFDNISQLVLSLYVSQIENWIES